MGYGFFEFGDEITFVAHDGARRDAGYTWHDILEEADREAALTDLQVPPVAHFAPLVRSLVLELRPSGPNRHASLAQLTLYAALATGRAARREHGMLGPYRPILSAGKAELAAAGHIGVQHWALERHTEADQAMCGMRPEEIWVLTAMLTKSISIVAPLLVHAEPGKMAA